MTSLTVQHLVCIISGKMLWKILPSHSQNPFGVLPDFSATICHCRESEREREREKETGIFQHKSVMSFYDQQHCYLHCSWTTLNYWHTLFIFVWTEVLASPCSKTETLQCAKFTMNHISSCLFHGTQFAPILNSPERNEPDFNIIH